MIQIFIIHAPEDATCAARLRTDLTAAGYAVWQNRAGLTPATPGYHRAIGYGILGSAAVVLVWSQAAAGAEQVEWEMLAAQRLQKQVLAVTLDQTPLPPTLVNLQPLSGQPDCEDVVARLQPRLPSNDNAFLQVLGRLSSDVMRERRTGIERAGELLAQNIYRQELLAALEFVAANDFMATIRKAAQRELDRAKGEGRAPALIAAESRHMVGVRCPNHHVSYYDRRQICPSSGTFKRSLVRRGGQELDEIRLPCRECDEVVIVRVDCQGYK